MLGPFQAVLKKVIGNSSDAASATGSVHAKLATLIPKVQRGIAAAAGNITISAIEPTRANVNSWSKGSAGRVGTKAITGTLAWSKTESSEGPSSGTTGISLSQSAGETDIFVKVYSARIVDATTIYVDGPCWWEVIGY